MVAAELRVTLLLSSALLGGCGNDLVEPKTGSIEITSTSTGEPADVDGYTLAVDGGAAVALGNNSSISVSPVIAGDHQLELSGVAANCVLSGANPRSIVVPGGSTVEAGFQIECHTPSGGIRILSRTSGEDPDPDGYVVSLDGAAGQTIGSSASLDLTGIMPGDHRLNVDGVAANCTIAGGTNRVITVGTATIELSLEVICHPAVGSLVISIDQTGLPHPNGFTVTVDGAGDQVINSGQALTLRDLRVGDHQVALRGLSANCVVQGANPRVATVLNGRSVPLTFAVGCTTTGLGTFLFSAQVGNRFHIFRLARDGRATDLTPNAQAERGRLSPDGKEIVFNSARSGTLGIWVMNADGSSPVRLTNNGETDPEWSPDGSRIIFWPDVTAGFGTISVMNASGGGAHDIGTGSEPNWSSTDRIAFERVNTSLCLSLLDICALDIFTMRADGTDLVKLTNKTDALSYAVAPAWSPDGSKIAFYSRDQGALSLKIMKADGSDVRTLASSQSFSGAAVWSPDGRSLAYAVSDSGVTSRILVQPLDGGTPALILQRDGLLEPTSWVQ